MSESNVSEIKSAADKFRPYPKESELWNRMNDLIHEYDGEISYVSVQGILADLQLELRSDMVASSNDG